MEKGDPPTHTPDTHCLVSQSNKTMSDSSFEREFYKSLGPILDQAREVLISRFTPRAQNRSVLDTGSGVIMLHDVHITDPEYFVKVSGFEASSKMTEGRVVT